MADCCTQIAGIYRIRNTVNGKVYIGSSKDMRRRIWRHKEYLRKGCHENRHLQNAYNKHGATCFSFEPVVALKDELRNDQTRMKTELLFWEQFFIDNCHSCDRQLGYNNDPIAGSRLGTKPSEETCRKLSAAIKIALNRPEVLEATRRRSIELGLHKNFGDVSGANNGMYGTHRAGAQNPFYGRRHTVETKDTIRRALTGRKLSAEQKKRIAESGKVAQNRPEVLEVNRRKNSGTNNSMYGKNIRDFMTPEAFDQMKSHMKISAKRAWDNPERRRQWGEVMKQRHFGNYLSKLKTVVVPDWT